MSVTIEDVAKKAGVSKTTVSRYLNGKYEFMSKETKNRIECVIDELEYVPNSMARSLKNQNSKIIGCTIADIENQFSSFIFKGVSEVCKKHGYRVLVAEINDNEDDEREAIESLMSYNIDGLIINTTGSNDEYLINLKKSNNIPIVLADRSIAENNVLDTVTSNNYEATYECMKHLKKQNYTKVAFFTYDMTNNSVKIKRYEAYCHAMKKLFNLNPKDYTYILKNKSLVNYDKALKDFIETNKNENIAIFTVNGVILLEVLKSLKKLNYDIEKDEIGICSFDDWGWAELIDKKGITTISQKSYECGVKCAELVFEGIEFPNKQVDYLEIPAKLIARGSTKKREVKKK
ncbi:LacI family DNA-binding transcriptional regulator [Caviibacter abscessus]|uniref:LacI family DNA-binding transcriptional regulator n=1 Tax=Caviibacter abscessus TaxID=1766719 RepID=UPI00082C10F8|nr:LacI family DNA-binding transcriptional regulator [Caviibacter abscessus]